MTKPSGNLVYALALAIPLFAVSPTAAAKSVDASNPLAIVTIQTNLDAINSAALTRAGECGMGEVVCAHDAPKKEPVQTAKLSLKDIADMKAREAAERAQ